MPADPNDATPDTVCEQFSAIVPGPGRGPQLPDSGQPTDMMTMIAADSAFDQIRLTSFAADGSSTSAIDPAVNITNGGADDVEAGDLMMLSKGNSSSLVQVTRVAGQQLFFEAGDRSI